MNTHADKTQENKSQSVANAVSQKQSSAESTFQFVDNRPEAIAQRKLQEMANNSPQAKQADQLQAMVDNYTAQQKDNIQKKENKTGLPDKLKSGIENLSGHSMDDVKVHYNSTKPAQLQAHAYAQGTDIHLASGQEKHLPHEAWHVVQQKQSRVKPTRQMKHKAKINDDSVLEKEADIMGAKALQQSSYHLLSQSNMPTKAASANTIQGKFLLRGDANKNMKEAVTLFMNAIRTINGELVQLIDASDDINVIIDPGTALGVSGSGDTLLERRTSPDAAPKETFSNAFKDIIDNNHVTDEMRTQPLAIRIKINQKGILGATTGSVSQLAETLAHEYSLHAEAQLEAIKVLRNNSLSNREALNALVKQNDVDGDFNNGDAQHKQLETQSGNRFAAMRAVIDEMKRNLTPKDAKKLEENFQDDIKDRH